MAIVRWDPFKDFLSLQEDLSKMFERRFGRGPHWGVSLWAPAIDVYEKGSNVVVKAELPGIKPEEIDVLAEEDRLTIKGERKLEEETKEEDYYRLERRYGSFERTLPLPTAVKTDKIKAKFKDGVLEVTLPKTEEAKPKEVKVKVEPK